MDSTFIRKQFSALNNGWILFENAGGTQVPDQVIRRVSEFYQTTNVQPGDFYPKAEKSEQVVQSAHDFVADLLGAASPNQVIFGPSATALNRMIAISFLRHWQAGDEIICTISDHEANVNPWIFLENFGLKVKFWKINRETFDLELEELQNLLSSKTRLVAFPHISNILGTENPVAKITRLAHEAGAWVYVDGVASTPHKPADVQAWDVDFFVFSTYKTFGPHMAALYGKEEHLLNLERTNHFFLPNEIPRKFELGTPNLEGCAALLGAEEYFSTVYKNEFSCTPPGRREMLHQLMEKISQYEIDLAWQLIDGLCRNKRIKIIGLADRSQKSRRVPVVAFTIDGVDQDKVVAKMAERNIAIGNSHFYAYRLIEYLGLLPKGGVLRAGLVHYNTKEEIGRFLDNLFAVI